MSEAPIPRSPTSSGANPARGSSLDELIALNDEIAALARAGVPIERGLAGLSGDLPGRLGEITHRLAERVGRGESLSAAMAAEPATFPPVYRALVEAGVRSGRLAPVLEGLANSARNLRDVQQTMSFALVYPVGVVILACCLLVFMLQVVMPNIELVYDHHPPARLEALRAVGTFGSIWERSCPSWSDFWR